MVAGPGQRSQTYPSSTVTYAANAPPLPAVMPRRTWKGSGLPAPSDVSSLLGWVNAPTVSPLADGSLSAPCLLDVRSSLLHQCVGRQRRMRCISRKSAGASSRTGPKPMVAVPLSISKLTE